MNDKEYEIKGCNLRVVLEDGMWRKEALVVLPTGRKVRVIIYG